MVLVLFPGDIYSYGIRHFLSKAARKKKKIYRKDVLGISQNVKVIDHKFQIHLY